MDFIVLFNDNSSALVEHIRVLMILQLTDRKTRGIATLFPRYAAFTMPIIKKEKDTSREGLNQK